MAAAAIGSFSQDYPERMHDARQPAEQGQKDVQPEVQAETHLQENAERRQEDGEKDADDVQWRLRIELIASDNVLQGIWFPHAWRVWPEKHLIG
jgi:hypothetical protein